MENYESKQRLTSYISFVRDCELEKPINEINEEIVGACVKLLLKLQGKEVAFTTEQIKEKVRKIPVVLHADTSNKTNPNVRKHINKKKILLIAAIIAIICTLLAVISSGRFVDYWHRFMNDEFGSVFNVPVGEEYTIGDDEFIHNGEINIYKNTKSFFKNETYNVLLPEKLPNEIELIDIQVMENEHTIIASFDSYISSYEILLNKQIPIQNKENTDETIIVNNILCLIDKIDGTNTIQIYFEYNNNFYTISGTDEQILLDIIKNLEEYKWKQNAF